MPTSILENVEIIQSSIDLDDFIEYLECKPGDLQGKIRMSIDNLDSASGHLHVVVPFGGNFLSEANAIKHLKYTIAKAIIDSTTINVEDMMRATTFRQS